MITSKKDIVDVLREELFVVTIHDCGKDQVRFCLAVKTDDPAELFLLGRALAQAKMPCPYYNGEGIAYFPTILVDAETYDYILAAP